MKEIRSEIEINAPIKEVWEVLVGVNEWHQWSPTHNQVSGTVVLNNKLSITMRNKEGNNGPKYQATLTHVEPPKRLRWRAKMMAGFLFTNDKEIELIEVGRATKIIHREFFSGALIPLFWAKMSVGVLPLLDSMNQALKNKIESTGAKAAN